MGRVGIHADRPRPETRLSPFRRIGILGHVGNGNLGDEAIIAAVIQALRERIPDAELTAFTIRPEDTLARHGIPAYPLRPGTGPRKAAPKRSGEAPATASQDEPPSRGVRRRPSWLRRLLSRGLNAARAIPAFLHEADFWITRYRRMRRVDLLIVAGSNQLSDYVGGPWGFPYTIFAWSLAARVAGTRVVFLSVGAGPIRSPVSRELIRRALGWAAYRSYRDVGSVEVIQGIGVRGPHPIVPDLAHGLRFRVESGPDSRAKTVAVNPLPYFDPRFWAESDPAIYARYVGHMAEVAGGLMDRGYRVRLVATQLRADPPVIADVLKRVTAVRELPGPIDAPVTGLDDLLAVLAEADVVIATRYHGAVLGQMLGKPTIGVAYRRSTSDLLADVGQGAYAMDIAALTPDAVLARFEALERDAGAAGRIAARLATYRASLAAQYDLILAGGLPAAGGAGGAGGGGPPASPTG